LAEASANSDSMDSIWINLGKVKTSGIHMKSAMKYPGAKNEISIESARYFYEKCNEIS